MISRAGLLAGAGAGGLAAFLLAVGVAALGDNSRDTRQIREHIEAAPTPATAADLAELGDAFAPMTTPGEPTPAAPVVVRVEPGPAGPAGAAGEPGAAGSVRLVYVTAPAASSSAPEPSTPSPAPSTPTPTPTRTCLLTAVPLLCELAQSP